MALWHLSHKVFGGTRFIHDFDLDCTLEIPTTQATPGQLNHSLGAWEPGTGVGLFVFKASKWFQCAAGLRAIG